MPRQQAATRQKRITRGARKGQTITVYSKSGSEVKAVRGKFQGAGINRTGNKRSGLAFTTIKLRNGRTAHAYANGQVVVLPKAGKRKSTRRGAPSRRRK